MGRAIDSKAEDFLTVQQAAFLRENAEVLLARRDAQIERQRAQLKKLEDSRASLRSHIRTLQDEIKRLRGDG